MVHVSLDHRLSHHWMIAMRERETERRLSKARNRERALAGEFSLLRYHLGRRGNEFPEAEGRQIDDDFQGEKGRERYEVPKWERDNTCMRNVQSAT